MRRDESVEDFVPVNAFEVSAVPHKSITWTRMRTVLEKKLILEDVPKILQTMYTFLLQIRKHIKNIKKINKTKC